MPRLSLQFLGTLQVTLDDVPIKDFESNKARALLVYLAVESDLPHQREKLAGLLWPDMTESDARRNLRHILFNLRKVLRDHKTDTPFLLTDRQSIQFNITNNVQLDIKVYTDAIAATKEHPHSSLESCDICIFLLSVSATGIKVLKTPD